MVLDQFLWCFPTFARELVRFEDFLVSNAIEVAEPFGNLHTRNFP